MCTLEVTATGSNAAAAAAAAAADGHADEASNGQADGHADGATDGHPLLLQKMPTMQVEPNPQFLEAEQSENNQSLQAEHRCRKIQMQKNSSATEECGQQQMSTIFNFCVECYDCCELGCNRALGVFFAHKPPPKLAYLGEPGRRAFLRYMLNVNTLQHIRPPGLGDTGVFTSARAARSAPCPQKPGPQGTLNLSPSPQHPLCKTQFMDRRNVINF